MSDWIKREDAVRMIESWAGSMSVSTARPILVEQIRALHASPLLAAQVAVADQALAYIDAWAIYTNLLDDAEYGYPDPSRAWDKVHDAETVLVGERTDLMRAAREYKRLREQEQTDAE
jgi:hypothetical protein